MSGDVDVCIVGAGAGGSALAHGLARGGLSVLVLDVGERPDRSTIPMARPDWELHKRRFTPEHAARDRVVYAPGSDPGFTIRRFKGLGGSTMHFEGFVPRHHPHDWQRKTRLGIGADWPIGHADLAPELARVETALGVSGAMDNPFEPPRPPYPNPAIGMSCAVQRLAAGAGSLGLHPAHAPLAILSRPAPGRAACNYCGGCWHGCMRGAISNASQAHLGPAERNGVSVRTGAMATRVVLRDSGTSVAGVEYLDRRGELRLQKARIVALCGNAVETARLLLMSARADHPDGLGNASGLVGKHFSAHTLVGVGGLLDARVDAYKGPNINGMIQDFYDHDDARGHAGGYVVVLRNAEGGPLSFRQRWLDGRLFGPGLYEAMERGFGHSVTLAAYGEHFATAADRVTLDPSVRDTFGLPVPRISIARRANEHAMLAHMEQTLRDILSAAGAQSIRVTNPPKLMGTHLMGTCRMGNDASRSVTDAFGEMHEVRNLFVADGSLFPTSTPGHPPLVLQGLATRAARRIASRARSG
jgi:choline dehydrogenase-like flavoprotein